MQGSGPPIRLRRHGVDNGKRIIAPAFAKGGEEQRGLYTESPRAIALPLIAQTPEPRARSPRHN
jgi:hypothetical protein